MSDDINDIKKFLASARAGAPAGSARAAARVVSLDELGLRRGVADAAPAPARWGRGQLSGRLVEVSGLGAVASLTAAIGVVLEAQVDGEPVAWISLPASTFFPPDLADQGIDLDALIVIRAPSIEHAGRAADRLLRSGGFGLVVLDLGPAAKDAALPIPLQGRLVGLAQRHDAAIVCLTEKPHEAASLGSMVSLRAEALRARDGERFTMSIRALKDKQRGPGWGHDEPATGPPGLG
jgi:recombination protein RecA